MTHSEQVIQAYDEAFLALVQAGEPRMAEALMLRAQRYLVNNEETPCHHCGIVLPADDVTMFDDGTALCDACLNW